MEKFLAFLILALSLNTNLAHANKLAAMAAAELTETIFDNLSDLPEGKCLSVAAVTPDRSDISHAVIQNIGDKSVIGFYVALINRSVRKMVLHHRQISRVLRSLLATNKVQRKYMSMQEPVVLTVLLSNEELLND